VNFRPEDLLALAPEIVLSSGALLLMLTEVWLRGGRRGYQPVVAAAFALAAFGFCLRGGPPGPVMGGFAVSDGFSAFSGAVVCVGLLLAIVQGAGFLRARSAERGEFYALCLLAAAGLSLMTRGSDLLLIFVGLEIAAVATYALVTYLRLGAGPGEAAFKYFLLGAFSSALYLYGTALCFGAAGTTSLAGIARSAGSPMLQAGLALVLAGMAFKVAAVPFHMWAPDVYEGAPTPVSTFLSVAVKAAAFAALLRILWIGFGSGGLAGPIHWQPALQGLAILTMVLGNLMALTQRSVKRMLAYSSVAQAGYLLVAVAAGATASARDEASQGLLVYLAAYTVTAAGAFGAVALLESQEPDAIRPWDLERFAGLARQQPVAAACIAVLMLSLSGIPPTAGFIAKLLVFRSAVHAGLIPLAVIGVLSSAVGLGYYLRVIVAMYFQPEVANLVRAPRNLLLELALVGTAAVVVWLGVNPDPLAAAAAAATLFAG
jgi:NADH-quinone oxidoreductase subunit N